MHRLLSEAVEGPPPMTTEEKPNAKKAPVKSATVPVPPQTSGV